MPSLTFAHFVFTKWESGCMATGGYYDVDVRILVSMFHAIWKPRAVCRLHGGRAVCRLHAMQSADCAATAPATTCTCVLWRDNFKENRENCHDFIVLYCVRNCMGRHFGSRESSSSQQPFIPCEQTCHCFPQLQARKRIITIVKKTEVIFL